MLPTSILEAFYCLNILQKMYFTWMAEAIIKSYTLNYFFPHIFKPSLADLLSLFMHNAS